jgi:acetyl esterase/lipase
MSDPVRVAYGPHPAQFGELSVPKRLRHAGIVVIIHGGFWRARYDLGLGRPLATDLAAHGFTCWNIEYRRMGDGGGWPNTFADVAAALDRLDSLDVDGSAVVAVGHSAGGHLATWAAGRAAGPPGTPGSQPRVAVTGVVSQAGVLDLGAAVRRELSSGAAVEFLGGTPAQVPDRYRVADPLAAVPLPVPVLCVHARTDENVPIEQSEAYVTAATRAGGRAALREVPGDHFTLIDPRHESWALVRDALPDLLAGRLPLVIG